MSSVSGMRGQAGFQGSRAETRVKRQIVAFLKATPFGHLTLHEEQLISEVLKLWI